MPAAHSRRHPVSVFEADVRAVDLRVTRRLVTERVERELRREGLRRPRAVNSCDMSRKGKTGPAPAGGWLDGDQQRAWLAYIRVQLRLAYEMNRQLLADSGMSLPDYDVLTALSVAEGGRMQITVLAAQIGWERSRVSHHVRRMSARGLVTCGLSAADRRVTEVALTGRGWQAQVDAAPGHVDLVRRLFFGGLPEGLAGPLGEALESVYANIIKQGSLPPPVDWHPAGERSRRCGLP